jgi:hypothetical protein
MSSSTRNAQALRLGSLTLQPVSDGMILQMDPANIFGDARPEEWQPYVTLNANGNLEMALTCLLVRVGERTILVDTGYGVQPDRPEVGQLANGLREVGVSAAEIDTPRARRPRPTRARAGTVLSPAVSRDRPNYGDWLGGRYVKRAPRPRTSTLRSG